MGKKEDIAFQNGLCWGMFFSAVIAMIVKLSVST